MPSRRRKRRRGAGVNATKSDIQTHLEKIPGAECVQDYVSALSSKEFNKLMKTYVKPLQKGGRRRTRKRRGGSPECGRCLAVCRCGNANRSPECRQCVSGRSMKSSSGTRRRARDGNHGIRRRGTRGNVPELEPRPRQEGPRAREDSRFDRCSPAKALCSARGPKSTACKQEKVCNDAIMAEIERLAEKNLKKGKGGESWRGQGRRERRTEPQDIPPEVAEASSFAEGLLDETQQQGKPIEVPSVLLGVIAAMITSYLWGKCRRRRGAGGNGGGSDGGSSGGRTIYPDDAYEAGSSVATPSTVGPMVDENNNASSGASAATMGGRRRSRRRRSRRRRRTRRRRRRRRR